MIRRDTIFTNVALTADNQPWWEGLTEGSPVSTGRAGPTIRRNGPAAHPNSRFTVCAQESSYSKLAAHRAACRSRRSSSAAGAARSRRWSTRRATGSHGVLVGAGVASETTAAATGAVGVVRRDPMAMKPFAGYNFGDYWAHWLDVGAKLESPPQIFHVNWFRRDARASSCGRVSARTCGYCVGSSSAARATAGARETPIGLLPGVADLDTKGLEMAPGALNELLAVNPESWKEEFAGIGTYMDEFGERLPQALKAELSQALRRVQTR
jgi:phosphoenolpyruvate carboxykinase (GTP)